MSRFQFQKVEKNTFLDYFSNTIQRSRFGAIFQFKCHLKNTFLSRFHFGKAKKKFLHFFQIQLKSRFTVKLFFDKSKI